MILNTNMGNVDTDSLSYRVGLEQGLAVGAITGGVNAVSGREALSIIGNAFYMEKLNRVISTKYSPWFENDEAQSWNTCEGLISIIGEVLSDIGVSYVRDNSGYYIDHYKNYFPIIGYRIDVSDDCYYYLGLRADISTRDVSAIGSLVEDAKVMRAISSCIGTHLSNTQLYGRGTVSGMYPCHVEYNEDKTLVRFGFSCSYIKDCACCPSIIFLALNGNGLYSAMSRISNDFYFYLGEANRLVYSFYKTGESVLFYNDVAKSGESKNKDNTYYNGAIFSPLKQGIDWICNDVKDKCKSFMPVTTFKCESMPDKEVVENVIYSYVMPNESWTPYIFTNLETGEKYIGISIAGGVIFIEKV